MDAKARSIREILQSGGQLLVPFFQRGYSWRRKDWQQLLEDILSLLPDQQAHKDPTPRRHFMGSMVCTLEHAGYAGLPVFLLIDGQQRITTLTLLLIAMRDLAVSRNDTKLSERIHDNFLVHRHEEGLKQYKILPRTGDREVFVAIVNKKIPKEFHGSPLFAAYRFFLRELTRFLDTTELPDSLPTLLGHIIDGLRIVVVTIDDENPFEIFESLNSTGMPLEESDLIRNFLFMQVPLDQQEAFHLSCWQAYEKLFKGGESEPSRQATMFYRSYLMRNGEYGRANCTFIDFKKANTARRITPEEQVTELTRFAEIDRQIRQADVEDSESLSVALSDLARLDATTVQPLLLNLFNRYQHGMLTESELHGCLIDLASFVIRRSMCGESTRAYGRWFVEAIACIDQSPRLDLQQYLLRRGWPDDAVLESELVAFPIYHRESRKAKLMLEKLEEQYKHKEKTDFAGLELEHVMPQTISGNAHGRSWKEMLGADWKTVHELLLHTLGNLTLTGYNKELSNSGFNIKRAELAKSKLALNKAVAEQETWTGTVIEVRTRDLANKLATIWPRPVGGPAYVPSDESNQGRASQLDAYWTAFREQLSQLRPELKIENSRFPESCYVHGPRRCFWYIFHADPVNKLITVGIETSGKSRKEWLALLWDNVSWDEQYGLEESTGADCWWRLQWCEMYFQQSEVDVRDTGDWSRQHLWFCDTFQKFESLFSPKIQSLSLKGFDPEILLQMGASDEEEASDDESLGLTDDGELSDDNDD